MERWEQLLKSENISLRDKGESPHQCSFATSKELSRQSNDFDKSAKRAPNLLPVSIASLNFTDKVDYKLVFHILQSN